LDILKDEFEKSRKKLKFQVFSLEPIRESKIHEPTLEERMKLEEEKLRSA